MKYVVRHDGTDHELEVHEREDGTFDVFVDGDAVHADFRGTDTGAVYSLLLDGQSHELLIADNGDGTMVTHHGLGVHLTVESERERNARLIAGDAIGEDGEAICAVMPGIVVSVAVAEGDEVEIGDAVCVLEAMKMENEIRAKSSGTVTKVSVSPGQTVNAGDALVDIE